MHVLCCCAQGGRPASSAEPTALQRALERCAAQAAPQRAKPAGSEHGVAADRFERLLAEAEACVRARSVSPCMLKGMPGASPTTGNMPAPRPITPLQLGINAVDAANGKAGLPRFLLGAELPQQDGQPGIANFMLPAAAVPRRPISAGTGDAYGRHYSLAQALAAAAAAEADSPNGTGEDGGMDRQGSQFDVSASNPGSMGDRGDAGKAFDGADVDAPFGADDAAGGNLPQHYGQYFGQHAGQHNPVPEDMQGHMQVGGTGRQPMCAESPSGLALQDT